MSAFSGKRALVTGAASGIGRSIALELARHGAHVYALDVDADGLANVVAELQALGVEAVGETCDLTQPSAVTAALTTLNARWGRLDVLVNNAGIGFYGPTDAMTGPEWDRLLGVNLLAPLQITRELLPSLMDRPDVYVLNVCSVAGLVAGPRFAAYHTSKFGLVGFTEALRAEYGRRGMNVTALCPGPVRTQLYARSGCSREGASAPEPPAWLCASPERVARLAVKALARNRPRVVVTPIAHALCIAKRFVPGLLDFMNLFGRRRKLKKLRAAATHEASPTQPTRKAA